MSDVDDTRLAKECDNEDAVDCSEDCMVFVLLFAPSAREVFVPGLDSVFRRRKMPETAYETGYVKYEDDRLGVVRCEGGARDGGEEGCVASVMEDMAVSCVLSVKWYLNQ